MKNTVHVKGCILRDAENERKRNYVNLMLTLKADGEEIYHYHLINYAANGNSVRHLFKVVNSDDKRKIEKLYEEKHTSKLARNRVVYREIDEEFDLEDHGKFVDELSGAEMKVLISSAKSLAGGMKARAKLIADIRTKREEDEEEEERSSIGLSRPDEDEGSSSAVSDDDLLAKEAATTFGKATSTTNKNWGMF
ncbi:hypothetical protein [Aeromonas sp. 602293]|uniref:hypothetical protein n=1 Tax=Aeromonas sp. 602293 TaxID=2712041 RepID=UPI003BA0F675